MKLGLLKSILAAAIAPLLLAGAIGCGTIGGLEANIHPGINKSFDNPDTAKWVERFEREEREVFARREEVVGHLNLEAGMDVADVGAGTGFYSLLMAEKVGPSGTVYSVDIAQNFIEYINAKAAEANLTNVVGITNPRRSTGLEPNSIDAAFMCDTYHHFEYPRSMMKSMREALRPGGVLLLVDMERIGDITTPFVLNMVRAGKGHFTDEIIDDGFEMVEEIPFTEKHYIIKFRKRELQTAAE